MKKFFSAILLIAAMAFSVSTFVSCNDLVEEVENVTAQTGANAEAIKKLQADLESGLAAANAAIDAAKTAAEAAVAEAKKAAIEEALAEAAKLDAENTAAIKVLQETVNGINGKIETNTAAIEAIKVQIAALEEFKKNAEEKHAEVEAAIEALEALKEDVETNKTDVAEVKEELEKINAMIEAIDARLVVVEDALTALAGQIQSVTLVPVNTATGEVLPATGLPVHAYKMSSEKTEVTFLATYEILPASAAAMIDSMKVEFVSVPTKAVATSITIPAEVVEKSGSRVVVRGHMTKGTGAYKAYYDGYDSDGDRQPDEKYDGLHVALKISDPQKMSSDSLSIDAGTYVTSGYTKVNMPADEEFNTTDLKYNQIEFAVFNNYGQIVSSSKKHEWTVNLPFGSDKTKDMFYPVLVFNNTIEGKKYMPIEDAGKVLGMDFKVTFNPGYTAAGASNIEVVNTGDKKDGKDAESPIVVNIPADNLFGATVAYQASDDWKTAKEAIDAGVKATVKLKSGAIKVNGITLGSLTATSTATIGNENSDEIIKFAGHTIPWSYKNGNMVPTTYSKELIVVENAGFADLNVLDKTQANSFRTIIGYQYGQPVYAYATVEVKTADDVLVSFTNLPYPQRATTYTFTGKFTHKNVEYPASFDVTVDPRPADKVIDLGTIEASGSASHDVTVEIAPLAKILTEDKAFYGDITLEDLKKVQASFTMIDDNLPNYPNNKVVMVNEAAVENENVATYALGYGLADDKKTVIEKSTLKLTKPGYTDEYYVAQKVTVCGVTYTINTTVQLVSGYKLETNPALVKDGLVTLSGKTIFPKFELTTTTDKDGKTAVTGGTWTNGSFTLDDINLRDYVIVKGESKDDIDNNELQLAYVLKTVLYNADGTKSDDVPATGFEATQYTTQKTNKAVWGTVPLAAHNNELVFDIALQSSKETQLVDGKVVPVTFATQTVTVRVNELLNLSTSEAPLSKTYEAGKANVVNIFNKGGVVLMDAAKTVKLYNDLATDLSTYFNGKNYLKDSPETNYERISGDTNKTYNIFGSVVTVNPTDWQNKKYATATYKSTGAEVSADYWTVEDNGDVKLNLNDGDLKETIVVSVPVELKHTYCGTTHKVVVTVEFKPAE